LDIIDRDFSPFEISTIDSDWFEATISQGGRWTKNRCGGGSQTAGVVLDVRGRDSGAMEGSVRRRTGSDDLKHLLRVVTGQWGARRVPAGAVEFLPWLRLQTF